ncbi:MAG: PAS domain S-box protein [Desulfobulbus sp.]|nr:PAS domain S-box protein [Desulfobulbus sp.]
MESEYEYRCAFLPQDVRNFSVLISLALLINLVLVRSDHLFLSGLPLFPWILSLRLAFFLFSLVTLAGIQRVHDPCWFDRWSLAWAGLSVIFVLLINLSRPASYSGHIALDLCVVLSLYIIQPGPMLWRVLPPLVFSLGNLILLTTVKDPLDYIALITPLCAYFAVNAMSWLFSSNWLRYRKSSFNAQKALEHLYRDSEKRRLAAEVSEKIWERIIDTSPNMLVVTGQDQRVTRVNKTLVDRLGLSKKEALGRLCCDLLCGFAEPPVPCPHGALCKSSTPRSMETFFPGLGVDVHLLSAPLVEQPANIPATVIQIRDISDWKRTELALKTAQEQYRSLVENCHGIIYTITPQGYVTYASPSFFKLLGFEADHVVGKHFSEVVHPDDVANCEAFQEELLRSGEGRQGLEYRILHRDGSVRWHLSNFIPRLNEQEQVESFVGNAMDITEQKQHQAQLKAAREAAEEASRIKSDFFALISHEIRTPLNAIVGFSGLARRTTDPDQRLQYIDILDQSAHLLMDLVNDVLDMSKVEAGQLTIDSIPFNLPETLELLRWQFAPVAEKKSGVKLHIQLGPNLPAWVIGDPTRLRQVLSNLLSNALKFTEAGSVTLKVQGGETEKSTELCRISFAVQDTGIGIDLSKQELLFQPFQQIEPGITRKYGGTGLGLAIVQKLVGLMGGGIEVQSRLGQGSCFTVHLSFRLCAPVRYEQIATMVQQPLSVLVVEDNNFNRLLLQETLKEMGHWVSAVDNAVDALTLVDNQPFDCIILDLWMPGLDGLELSTRLRMLESPSQIPPTPIVAYTADTDDRSRQRALQAGVQAVLCKPLDPQQLRLILSNHCRAVQFLAISPNGADKSADMVIVPPISHGLNARVIADMGHDQERIATYAELLWGDIETELNQLDQALLIEDRRRILEASHSLKGLCGYLSDDRAGELALQIHEGAMDLAYLKMNELVKQLHSAITRPAALSTNTL